MTVDVVTDLQPFCDIGTHPDVSMQTESATFCTLVRSGRSIELQLVQGDSGITVRVGRGRPTSFAQFLLSSGMADVSGVFDAQRRSFARFALDRWVASEGQLADGAVVDSLSYLAGHTGPMTKAAHMRMLLVDGPAGIGKSQLLRKFCDASTSQLPYLLVSSQGRRLSRLTDAIAATLNSLKVPLSVDEFLVLAKYECVGLVIDGFDELVNQEGYEDAWASLSDFLQQIQSRGTLIISARDTFFDANEFFKLAGTADALRGDLEICHLRMRPWRTRHIDLFLQTSSLDDAGRQSLRDWVHSDALELLSRPFFVRQIEAHLLENISEESASISRVVIGAFVAREAKTLTANALEVPVMESVLTSFFEDVAGEMLQGGSGTISVEVLQFWLDLRLEAAGVDPVRKRAIVHRASSVALMEAIGGSRRERTFPHEFVFHYFASARLWSALRGRPDEVVFLLSSAPFSLDLADAFVAYSEGLSAGPSDATAVLDLLDKGGYQQPTYGNLGGLLFAVFRSLPFPDSMSFATEVAGHQFGSVSLSGFFPGAVVFRGCSFEFLDASDFYGFDAEFHESYIQRLRVNEGTSLGGCLPVVQCIEDYADD